MKKVDWTKPVETQIGLQWYKAEVLKVFKDGTAAVAYYIEGAPGVLHVARTGDTCDQNNAVRNAPETVTKVVYLFKSQWSAQEGTFYADFNCPPEGCIASTRVTFTAGEFAKEDG